MKTPLLLCALWALLPAVGSAQSVLSFPDFFLQLSEIPTPELSRMEDLIRVVSVSRDSRELIETLRSIDNWTRGVTAEEEMLLVAALQSAASNPVLDASVRAKAVDSLGRACLWLQSDVRLSDAFLALVDIVKADHPLDNRRDLRLPALMGLARAIHRVPSFNRSLVESILNASFDVIHDNSAAQENILALAVVQKYLLSHGSADLFRCRGLDRRFEAEILGPVEMNLPSLYGDMNRPLEYRYHLVRALILVGWSRHADQSNLRHRCRQVLRNMEPLETDPQLRRLVETYSRDSR
ncbi:MAG: hypothetical protein WC943_07670 [Elusimicrobiota bacterium]|jgi:hypothetical protein